MKFSGIKWPGVISYDGIAGWAELDGIILLFLHGPELKTLHLKYFNVLQDIKASLLILPTSRNDLNI